MIKLAAKQFKLWQICLPLLALANIAYLPKDFVGWIFTLCFFLFVPGYLLLNYLKHDIKNRWEIASFSLGLSLLLLMVGGLLLNSLHAFGLNRSLTTWNIFTMLDIVTLLLLVLTKHRTFSPPQLKSNQHKEQLVAAAILSLLPLLAIGGAIRLNNGASNILTMILFAVIPILFILLVCRKSLKPIYPYAIFMFGLAVLFSTSLRGWSITGHDIQHEFRVFQVVSNNGFWNINSPRGDPYNACLSITILPTIIDKITSISAPYVFKAIFQIIFAFGLIPIYFLIKRIYNARTSLMATFVFIAFPTFLDDMSFLNRQEISFVFFGLLILTTFRKMAYKSKVTLTFLFLFGLILSHYSSGYVAVLILTLSWIMSKFHDRKRQRKDKLKLPVLRFSFIFTALLFTFLWNLQITASTSNLSGTLIKTAKEFIGFSPQEESLAQQYGLLNSNSQIQNTPEALAVYAGKYANQIQYIPTSDLNITHLGMMVSRIINVTTFNYFVHNLIAKVFQVLLLVGVVVLFLRYRKTATPDQVYFYAMIISCVILLFIWTILPQLSVDYTPIRLFQQTLVITALPMVLAAEFLFSFFGRYKLYVVLLLFAFLFWDLSGFIPQSLGGFLPQLSLNNSGQYYDFFYNHKSDTIASEWLTNNRKYNIPVFLDTTSSSFAYIEYPTRNDILQSSSYGYLQLDYTNVHKEVFRVFVGGLSEYSDPTITENRNLLYDNQNDMIYSERSIL